jgi:FkbM family methyltransferase
MIDTKKQGYIVTYYKSTPDGERILIDLINTISKTNIYLVLGSHSADVPLEIQQKCDFYFYQELNIVDDRKYSHGVAENNIIEIALQHLKWKGIEWTFKSCYDIIVNDIDRFNDWVKDYKYNFVSCIWGDNFLATHSFFANVDFILNNIKFYKTVEDMFSINTVLENCWQRDIEIRNLKNQVFSYPSKVDMYGDNQIDVIGYNYSNFEFWYSPSEWKFFVKNNGEDYLGDIRIFDYYSDVCLYYEKNFRHDSGITMWISPPMVQYMQYAKNGFYLELYKNGITIRKNIMIYDFNYKDPFHKKFRIIKYNESKFNEYIEFDDLMEYSVLNIDIDSIKTFIDIGANYGFSSVPFMKKGIKTYMIEGDKNNAEILNQMYGKNNNIKIIDKVISDIDGEIDLYIDDVYSTISSIFETDANGKSDNKTKITVPSITPNTLIEKCIEEDVIDLMKVDIEGAEYKLFESISDSNLKKVNKFMIEFHNNDNYQVMNILTKLAKNDYTYKLYNLPFEKQDYVVEQSRGFIYAWR